MQDAKEKVKCPKAKSSTYRLQVGHICSAYYDYNLAMQIVHK